MERCSCHKKSCKVCRDHKRYIRERPLRLRRSKVYVLRSKYSSEDSMRLMDDFIAGRLSLNDLEVELNGRA
jgi:hypothetical protein